MTIINRALLKAYERRDDTVVASELDRHPSTVVRGWARKLREPIRGVPRELLPETPAEGEPTRDVATTDLEDAPVAIVPSETAPEPVISIHREDGTTLRFDSAHDPAVEDPPEAAALAAIAAVAAGETPAAIASAVAAPSPALAAEPPAAPEWAWPSIVERLLASSAAGQLRELADRLQQLAVECDVRCIVFSGPGRRAGRTSLVATLAWVLAEEKAVRVAIVDAHFENPGLAQTLSLRSGQGTGSGGYQPDHNAADAAISLTEKLAIVPVAGRTGEAALPREKSGSLQRLLRTVRCDHDVVLVDAGPWEPQRPPAILECRAIDGFVCVGRSDAAPGATIDEAGLVELGIEWLGRIENFVSP